MSAGRTVWELVDRVYAGRDLDSKLVPHVDAEYALALRELGWSWPAIAGVLDYPAKSVRRAVDRLLRDWEANPPSWYRDLLTGEVRFR